MEDPGHSIESAEPLIMRIPIDGEKMASKKKWHAETLLDITQHGLGMELPLWSGLRLFTTYAILENPIQAVPGQIGHQVAGQCPDVCVLRQYILPLLFLPVHWHLFLNNANVRILWAARNESRMIRCHDISWRDLNCSQVKFFECEVYVTEIAWRSRWRN